jgi:DUF1365 family protein
MLMLLLDLDETDSLSQRIRLFSTTRPAPVQFRRSDHWGNPSRPLKDAVQDLVQARTGARPMGPVRLLTQPRCWGIVFNPISIYYCYGPDGESLQATVAEVTNTPWGERHCYVLPEDPNRRSCAATFSKALHVSPFMAMNQEYRWRSRPPGNTLAVHLESREHGETKFDATLSLRRQPLTSVALASCLAAYPFATAKVIAAIHWQALRLFVKGLPVYPHPARTRTRAPTRKPSRMSMDRDHAATGPDATAAQPAGETPSGRDRTSLETQP